MKAEDHRLRFCLALAAAGVLARFVLVDELYFQLLEFPEHDMSQGLAFFATSMHSMRIAGDLAWWNPASFTGYAQYYQALFSPLAPSYGHIVFIVWAEIIGLLGAAGVAIPEYYQYLAVNYLVLPFLAFTAFAWFCSRFLRRRESIALAVLVYVLSGIGLWYSAWFYFQEAFSVLFLLGTSIALLQRPASARALAWLAAVLVQLASINYWTVYNIFFVAIVVGAYAATHRNQCVRLAARVRRMVRLRPRAAALVCVAFGLAAVAWLAVIAAALHEQAASQVRTVFQSHNVALTVLEMRRSTTELFNPSLERTLRHYPAINEIHNARYLGLVMLPLIAAGVFAAACRRSRWLLACTLLVLAVAVASPVFVDAWMVIPTMDRIRHVFYFYSHYWQIMLVLLGAVGLDVTLGEPSARRRRLLLWIAAIGAGLALATFAMGEWFSHEVKDDDATFDALLRSAVVLGLASVVLFRALWSRHRRETRFAGWALVLIAFVDLAGYFHTVARADMAFTHRRWPHALPDDERRFMLARPWAAPDPRLGFGAGLDRSMPIVNDFWPANLFMVPSELRYGIDDSLHRSIASRPPLAFYPEARVVPDQHAMPRALVDDPAPLERELIVARPASPSERTTPSVPAGDAFSYRWTEWGYNRFALEVTAPREGWLLVRQHDDPAWQARIDGMRVAPTQANYLSMALPISRGSHRVEIDYRPLSRRLYWPAALLLQAVLAAFLACAWRGASRPADPGRAAPA